MEFSTIGIAGPIIIRPKVFEDERGYFYESFNKRQFSDAGIHQDFVQDNQSLSQAGTLRGLHFQSPPYAQGKLVRVISGAVYDAIVDIRKNSNTYGMTFGLELSAKNFTMLWVPPGFAHGFLTLENDTIFSYKCTGYYNKASEGGIIWNDKKLGINWGIMDPVLSEKDRNNPTFKELESPFS